MIAPPAAAQGYIAKGGVTGWGEAAAITESQRIRAQNKAVEIKRKM